MSLHRQLFTLQATSTAVVAAGKAPGAAGAAGAQQIGTVAPVDGHPLKRRAASAEANAAEVPAEQPRPQKRQHRQQSPSDAAGGMLHGHSDISRCCATGRCMWCTEVQRSASEKNICRQRWYMLDHR